MNRPAPHTFATKKDAEVWLVDTEAEIRADQWLNPDDGRVAFAGFAEAWIDERTNLRPSTVQVYRYVLRRHLIPALGPRPVADIREAHVRRWRRGCSTRRGDLELCTVRVERSLSELPGGGFFYGPPKSAAGAGLWPSRTRDGHDLARELRGEDRLVPKPSEGGCCVAC